MVKIFSFCGLFALLPQWFPLRCRNILSSAAPFINSRHQFLSYWNLVQKSFDYLYPEGLSLLSCSNFRVPGFNLNLIHFELTLVQIQLCSSKSGHPALPSPCIKSAFSLLVYDFDSCSKYEGTAAVWADLWTAHWYISLFCFVGIVLSLSLQLLV